MFPLSEAERGKAENIIFSYRLDEEENSTNVKLFSSPLSV